MRTSAVDLSVLEVSVVRAAGGEFIQACRFAVNMLAGTEESGLAAK